MHYTTCRFYDDPDTFVVKPDCTCWCGVKRCWQQTYTGLLCRHSILVVVERLRMTRDRDVKKGICKSVVSFCHLNWHRTTYDETPEVEVVKPPTLCPVTLGQDPRRQQYMERFRNAIQFMSSTSIEDHLQSMETSVFDSTRSDPVDTVTKVLNVDLSDETVMEFANPRKRPRRRKLDFVNTNSEDI